MTITWSTEQLQRIGASEELEIAVRRADGSLRAWVPVWVVCANGRAYVRTWHWRADGWFGHVLESHRARIRVPHIQADVAVSIVGGAGAAEMRTSVDNAYRAKYDHYGTVTVEKMASDAAAATTLWLQPE